MMAVNKLSFFYLNQRQQFLNHCHDTSFVLNLPSSGGIVQVARPCRFYFHKASDNPPPSEAFIFSLSG